MTARTLLRHALSVAVTLAVVCASLSFAPPRATATGTPDGERVERSSQAVVTLVTGDRVILGKGSGDEPTVLFEARGKGKSGAFQVERGEAGIHVIPNDVAHLVPEVLDPELFNVTALVEMGYDDASTDELPLIVDRASGVRRLADADTPLESNDELTSIGATAATLDKAKAATLGGDLASLDSGRAPAAARALGGATKIWLDGKVEGAALDGYLDQVNAPEAWENGLDGAGVKVAVLDSGVDDGHPALVDRVVAEENFSEEPSADDGVGHGTHVASLLAGSGAGSSGARQGIAPDADLVSGKVLGDDNRGLESWVIAGMEWAAAQDVDVVNLSLGGPPAEQDDPVVQSLEHLTEETGALFVVAAGNRGGVGFQPFTINSPGTAPSALTVGAVRADDHQARFASEGPTTGSYLSKPDVVAPGVDILGARAGARDGDLYTPLSGTSMATPIVAGAAALLKQQHPGWTAEQIKARIVTTAGGHNWFRTWTNGSGRLDLDAATGPGLVSDTANLDFGYLRHPNDAIQERTVSLTNTGTASVTVDVHDEMESLDLETAGDAAVTASPATLTIPPGGSAATTISFDPGQLTDFYWQGVVTFDSGEDTLLRLPVGGYDEPPRHDLDVQVLNRNGEPYDPAIIAEDDPLARPFAVAFNTETGNSFRLDLDATGHASARVDAGHYSIFSHVRTPEVGDRPSTLTVAGTAEVQVQEDTSYVLDARKGRRLDEVTIEGEQTRATLGVGLTYRRVAAEGGRGLTNGLFFDPQEVRDGRIFVTPTPEVTTGQFESTQRWHVEPTGKISPEAPDAYDLVTHEPSIPATMMSPRMSRQDVRDLARVEQVVHPLATSGEHALVTGSMTTVTQDGFKYVEFLPVPSTRTVLTTADPDVAWQHCLEISANLWRGLCRASRPFDTGSRQSVELGAAVHAAAVEVQRSATELFAGVGLSDGIHRMRIADIDLVETSELRLSTPTGDDLGSAEGTGGYFPVPDDLDRFRLTHTWALKPGALHAAGRSRTVWEFGAEQGVTPVLLDAEYGPDVDLLGRARPRHPLRLDLSFESGELNGTSIPGRIADAHLRWSSDEGERWHSMQIRRTGKASYAATVPGKALLPGGTLSLNVVATDALGNSIDQTTIALVPVRLATSAENGQQP